MQIVLQDDGSGSYTSAPADFKAALAYAANYLGNLIANTITVTIDVGYGTLGGSAFGGYAEGGPYENIMDYPTLREELIAAGVSAYLPQNDPFNGTMGSYAASNAEFKAWGLTPFSSVDGTVGFCTAQVAFGTFGVPFNYNTTNRAVAGEVDFVGVALHELSHALGRIVDVDALALYRYTAPGVIDTDMSGLTSSYFSLDGGQTNLDNFDSTGSDPADWAPTAGADANDAVSDAGQLNAFTQVDIEEMAALGFTISGTNAPVDVSSGQTSNGVRVLSGNILDVLFGGTASSTVDSGGIDNVLAGGMVISTTISSGGTEQILSGGSARNTVVSPGGRLELNSAGQDSLVTVFAGGTDTVISGGADLGTLMSGGTQLNYGFASGATVFTGGSQLVESGGSTSSTRVSGGKQVDSGTTFGTTIFAGGQQIVRSGGVASGSIVSGGGVFSDFGSASGTTVRSAGTDVVQSGGVETNAIVSGGGTELIEAHGVANALTVSSGGVVANSGGAASGTIVQGLDYLQSGSVETSAILSSGGTEFIYPGGTALALTVLNGGVVANSGGTASVTIVRGLDYLESGSVEIGATLSGGTAFIASGGTALGLTVSSGGVAANFGGSASGTIVDSGGLDYLEPGAVETGAALSSGGIEFIEAGGTTLGLVVSGGGVVANFGGSASGTTVDTGGLDYLESGGVESSATLSGGIEFIEIGGTAFGLTVSADGVAADFGGSASGTIVRSGGQDYLESGAVEIGATLASGSVEYLSAGGLARSLAVGAGGTLADYGGSASGTIVSSGGQEYLEPGAVETSATIDRFGAEFIESGATAIGGTVSGLVDLTGGGVISGTVTFGLRGQLQLADSQDFHNLVAGFSGTLVKLDLQDITYVSGATTVNWTQLTSGASASGTLTVSEGGHAANITLLGQYATGNFVISGDGGAGTMVTDPPLAPADSATFFVNPRH